MMITSIKVLANCSRIVDDDDEDYENISKLIQNRKIDSSAKLIAADLCTDLIAEIFARLPMKPLLKFRCLSKYWNLLISSKQFIKTHLQTNTNYNVVSKSCKADGTTIIKQYSLHSLFFEQTTYAADINCSPNIHPYVEVVDTVNGLYCLFYDRRHIVLWNPSTRKFKQLSKMDSIAAITTVGFGLVNGSNDDYKVFCAGLVRERVWGQQIEVVAAIYSLKTDSWRLIPNSENRIHFKCRTRFVCGKIHWLTSPSLEILSFDLDTEAEEFVPQPSSIREGSLKPSLSKLGGNLCLFLYPGNSKDVWVMKDYGIKESWVKVVTIHNVSLPWNNFAIGWRDFTPLYVSEDGVILFASASTFIIYNPKDEAFRYPQISNFPLLEGFDYRSWGVDIKVNIQSLVSPFPDV